MSGKHTPGPWWYTAGPHLNGMVVADGYKLGDDYIMADMEMGYDKETATANGNLILAAPDLLDACIRAAEDVRSEYCSHGGDCSADNPRCYARYLHRAIAKAEGRA